MKYLNRDGVELIFQESYKFKIPPYTRFGGEPENIEFIDPPGGPFIEVGRNFDGKLVSKIEGIDDENVLISFKEES